MESVLPSTLGYHWVWVEVIGPDSQDFLQRLSTVAVKNQKSGTGQAACFLSGVGKIEAFFYLWKISPEHFGIEIDAGVDENHLRSLLAFIEKYTFRENLKVEVKKNLKCLWHLNTKEAPFTFKQENDLFFCHHSKREFGIPWASVWSKNSTPQSSIKPLFNLEELRIQNLMPRYPNEIASSHLPLEIGLADAIISGKGCYPGQEVIERIWTYGSPPQRLCLLKAENKVTKIPIELNSGKITSTQGHQALGLVKKQFATPGTKLTDQNQNTYTIEKVAPYQND